MSSDLEEEAWEPLNWEVAPTGIRETAGAELYDLGILKAWVVSEYSRQSGKPAPDADALGPDRGHFNKWWWYQLKNSDVVCRKFPRLQWLLHLSLSGKINALAQRHCYLCDSGNVAAQKQAIYVSPVRLAPESRQVLKSVNWRAFQSAVKFWFSKRDIQVVATHLCVALTFVLNKARNDRDLDNMTKALMDAYARALGFNDVDVHHLDIMKIIAPTEEEYCYIRLAPSSIADLTDVVFSKIEHEWGVEDALVLADFVA